MKKVLYTIPAVIICLVYGMLAMLAGGFASFQLRAWLIILLPVLSAVLLNKGKWWGCLPGMALGGLISAAGMTGNSQITLALGIIILSYYLVMGVISLRSRRITPDG